LDESYVPVSISKQKMGKHYNNAGVHIDGDHRHLSEFHEAVIVDNLEPVHQVGVRPQFAMT